MGILYRTQQVRLRLKGYRTIVFNSFWVVVSGIIAVAPEMLAYLATFEWGIVVTPRTAAIIGLVIFTTNLILRKLTTTPLGQNGDENRPTNLMGG